MLSQMWGVGATGGYGLGASQQQQQQPQAQGGKAGQPRQEEVELCIAVSIRLLQAAAAEPHSEAGNILIHGKEVATVILVAMVEEVVSQGSSIEILVNDSTGRLKLKYYVTEGVPEEVASLHPGQYISVAGQPRVTPSLHVSAVALRRTRTPDEVSYHMIEVAHTGLKMAQMAGQSIGNAQEFHTPPRRQAATNENQMPEFAKSGPAGDHARQLDYESPPKDGLGSSGAVAQVPAPMEVSQPNMQDAILSRLRQVPSDGPGLEIGALLKDIKLPGASEADVRKMLSQMVEDGDVIETIDSNHFAIV